MSAFYNVDQPPFNSRSSARAIAAANNGLLFDIGDMPILFQDDAGTVPVTAVGQPVGLVLDKSQGLMLGPELVTNGDFNLNIDGWSATAPALVAWQEGELVLTNTSGGYQEQVNYALTPYVSPSKIYRVTVRARRGTASSFAIVVDGNSVSEKYIPNLSNTEMQTYSFMFLHRSGQTSCTFRIRAERVGTVYLDDVSIKEVLGNHATQPITASRPTLSARKNVLLATETLATQSVTTIAAQYTLSFTGTGSVTLSGAATGTLTGTGADNRVSLTVTPTAGTLTLTVSGAVTKAQLELGAVAGPYQRVNTSTDYDTDERYFPKYLRFDGVDDYLNLPYMGLYANGSASVVAAGEFDTTYATHRILNESSNATETPMYSLRTFASPNSGFGIAIVNDAGSILLNQNKLIQSSTLKVVSSVDNGLSVKASINSVDTQNNGYSRSGTVTLNNTTIGAKVSVATSGYMPAKLYGLIITKSALTDAQRVRCERFLAQKAGVML